MFAHDVLRLLVLLAQCLLDGFEQLRDGGFAFLERRLRSRLVASEDLARQFEKGFAVGIERQARGAFDRGAHLRLALRQQLRRADALLFVRRDSGARGFELAAQRFGAPRSAQRADQVSDDGRRERGEDADEKRVVHTEPLRELVQPLDQFERSVQPAMREPSIGAIVVAEIAVPGHHRVHARGLCRLHVAFGIADVHTVRRAKFPCVDAACSSGRGCGLRSAACRR